MATHDWIGEGLQFGCTGCGSCCCGKGYVWVDRREIRALARFLEITTQEFGQRYLRRVGRRLSLVEKPDFECVFWEQGCRVYDARPTQCRTFPFWERNLADPQAWRATGEACEGVGQGRVYTRAEIRRLAGGRGRTAEGPEPVAGSCRAE